MKTRFVIKVLLSTLSFFFLYSCARAFRFAPSFSEVIFFSLVMAVCCALMFFKIYGAKGNQASIILGFCFAVIFHHFPVSADRFDLRAQKFRRNMHLYGDGGCAESALSKNTVVAGLDGDGRPLFVSTFTDDGRIVSVDEYSAVRAIPPMFINWRLIELRESISGFYGYVQCSPSNP